MSYNKNMSLSNLLDKIKKIPVLKKNEEEELASWFNSNELARPIYEKILIYHNLRLARHIANRFMDRGYELEDLISEAVTGLKRAAEKFNPKLGYRFSTYAGQWINQRIQKFIQTSSTIKIPVLKYYAIQELHSLLNVEPLETIREKLKLSKNQFNKLYQAYSSQLVESIDVPLNDHELIKESIPVSSKEYDDLSENLEYFLSQIPKDEYPIVLSYLNQEFTKNKLCEIYNLTLIELNQILNRNVTFLKESLRGDYEALRL
jgi:RNA polymerase sigma factor (sigma-70 family)